MYKDDFEEFKQKAIPISKMKSGTRFIAINGIHMIKQRNEKNLVVCYQSENLRGEVQLFTKSALGIVVK